MKTKEPLILYGEGDYALTDVKKVVVTKAFMNLDEGIKNCQNIETYKDCLAKEYIIMGLEMCNCTPFELRNYSKSVRKNAEYFQTHVEFISLGNTLFTIGIRML